MKTMSVPIEQLEPLERRFRAKRPIARFVRGAWLTLFGAALSSSAWAGLTAAVTVSGANPINPGQTTSIVIELTNNSIDYPLTAVGFARSLTGTLPNGLKVAGAATNGCGGTLTAVPGTQAISLVGGTVPVKVGVDDGKCTITIPVTGAGTAAGGQATYNYTLSANDVSGDENGSTVRNTGASGQGITVNALTQPTITKRFGPDANPDTAVLGGASVPLTITVSNPGAVALPNFSVSDVFPLVGGSPAIKVANPTGAVSTCTAGGTPAAFAPAVDATSIGASGGTVAAGGSCTITVNVVGASTNGSYSTGALTNTINRSTQFANDFGLTAQANASDTVTVRSPLRVTKAFNHAFLSSGQSDTFDVVLYNDGSAPLTVNSFTDSPIDGVGNLAYGLKVNSVTPTCTGGGIPGTYAITASNLGVTQTGDTTIAANGSCTIRVNFTGSVQATGVPRQYTNSIGQGTIGTATAGVVNESATSSVTVADDLRVTKSATPSSVVPGGTVRFTVRVENFGTAAINNVVVTDHLPANLTFLTGGAYAPSVAPAGCGALGVAGATGAATPVFTVATLPARADVNTAGYCDVTFWAMASAGAANGVSLTNTINAGDVCYNAGATCNGGTATPPANPSVTTTVVSARKVFHTLGTPVPATQPTLTKPEGTIVRLSIEITNLSANALTNVTISDTLPISGAAQLRIANPANASSTCGTPVIDAAPGGTSLGMNGGTVPARADNGTGAAGSCLVQVDVVGPAGTFDNTATVAGTQTYANGTPAAFGPVASNTARVVYDPSLQIVNKTFNPAAVASGGRSTVRVRLNNTGAVALTGVALQDPLPTGMVVANPANAYSTCAGSPTFTAVPGAGSASMSGASLAGNGTCDFLFDVVATGAAAWTNTIPAGNLTADGGIRSQTPTSGVLNLVGAAPLSVTKATNPAALTFPGQSSLLTITVTGGSQPVTNLQLTDYFTADGSAAGALNGWRVAATPNAVTTCPGGTVTALPNGTSVGLSGVNLPASGSCTVTVNVTSVTVGGVSNIIPAGAIRTDQGLSNPGAAMTSLSTQANVGITKQFTPNVVKPGERARLKITFHNPTSLPLADLGVTDNLPAGVTVPSGANPATTCVGGTVGSPAAGQVVVSGATLGAGASCVAEIDVLVAAQGDYVNTIPASAVTATSGGAPATNSQPTSDTLRAKAPLEVHKAIGGNTRDPGNPAGFTTGTASRAPGVTAPLVISLRNPNGVALTGVSFTDNLPDGLVLAAPATGAATTCAGGTVVAAPAGTSVRLAGATINANSSCTVTVDVLSNVPGNYLNAIPGGAVTTAEGVVNEEKTQAELLVSKPPTVSKQFSPAVVPANGTSRLTIFLGNDNAAPITLTAALVDTLPTSPDAMRVANPPNLDVASGGRCLGAVTAAANAATVTYANGATIPPGGCTITLDVTAGAVAGTYNNNIPAGDLKTSVGNNQQPANAGVQVSALGYVSGKVFKDNSVVPNGTFQSGTDTPIAGTAIELRSGGSCAGPLVATTATDAAGNYLFANLAAGAYSVCQPAQPSGTTNGITTAGTIVGIGGSDGTAGGAANPTPSTSQITGIVLNGNGGAGEISGSVNNNFAEVVPSSIAGQVFLDQNNDGLLNGTDSGIAGVPVELLDAGGTVVATTATAADGSYRFDNLLPGTYSVREPTQPADTSNGITTAGAVPNGGTAGTASAPAVLPSRISNIVLPPNTTAGGNNFAEIGNGRTLSGSIFLDFNNNGLIDGNDHGIGGQTVNLTGTDVNGNPVSRTATTAPDGSYRFTGLPEGTYTVTQPAQPPGTGNGTTVAGSTGGMATAVGTVPSAIAGINLTGANTVSANNNFAEVPGAAPDLAIAKTHAPASFGEGSGTGYFTITPRNIGTVATSGTVTITDTLPAGMTVGAVATGAGWSCVGSVGASAVTCTSALSIPANGTGNPITLHVVVANGLAGQILTNTAVIAGGGEPPGFDGNNEAKDPVPVATTARLSGTVWRDANHDRLLTAGEPAVSGWLVEVLLGGVVVATTTTGPDGRYVVAGLAPGGGYDVRFRDPLTGTLYGRSVTNEQGIAAAPGVRDSTQPNAGTNAGNPAGATPGGGVLSGLTLLAGDNIVEQSLPLDPSGVVYDAVTRQPVAGATVSISGPGGFIPATHLVGGNATQVTGASGYYEFLLLPGAPAGVYTLTVSAPGYLPAPSSLIPACVGTLVVGGVPAPAVIQASVGAPAAGVPLHNPAACVGGLAPNSTQYYFSFNLDVATSANVVQNHLPLDPILGGAIVVSKTSPMVNVTKSDLVPYTITATNTLAATLANINVQDQIPPGFRYRSGSASYNGFPLEPAVSGRLLEWRNQTFAPGEKKTYKLILVVGAGVGEGEYVNQAWALNSLVQARVSNIGSATVRVVPDPTFDCSDIIGKVFDDRNANGYQDQGEPGIPNVRVVTARGLLVTTDADGRFHVACAAIPQADRGSNFVMKLDDRTLPSGYRVTTENPRDVRVTRGKMVKLNFGATVHKVLRLEVDGRAFAAGETALAAPWTGRVAELLQQLRERPSVLRIAYRAADEGNELAAARLAELARRIKAGYAELSEKEKEEGRETPPLVIETESLGGNTKGDRK